MATKQQNAALKEKKIANEKALGLKPGTRKYRVDKAFLKRVYDHAWLGLSQSAIGNVLGIGHYFNELVIRHPEIAVEIQRARDDNHAQLAQKLHEHVFKKESEKSLHFTLERRHGYQRAPETVVNNSQQMNVQVNMHLDALGEDELLKLASQALGVLKKTP